MNGRLPGLIAVLVFAALGAFTSDKLHRMAQIRGWTPGRVSIEAPVISKRTTEDHEGRTVFHIAWAKLEGVRDTGANVSEELWDELTPRESTIELATVRDRTYVVRGIYASDGNVGFDIALLLIWLAGFGWGLRRLVRGAPEESGAASIWIGAEWGPPADESTFRSVSLPQWLQLGMRLLLFGGAGFVVGCLVAIELFGRVPAPWYFFTPPTIVGLVLARWTFAPHWDLLRFEGAVLRLGAENRADLVVSLAEIELVVGEHGFDHEQQNEEAAFLFWKWVRITTPGGSERIELEAAENRRLFDVLRTRCPNAVSITPEGEVRVGPEATSETVRRAGAHLRRRVLRYGVIVLLGLAIAIGVVVALVLGEADPPALLLTIVGAIAVFAFGRRLPADVRAWRRTTARSPRTPSR